MSESYQEHLAQLHAQQTISAELLNDILHQISPQHVLSKQRIISGERNEVYDVTFVDGLQIIVRISRSEAKNFAHFEQELWAIQECGARGVPVPEILSSCRIHPAACDATWPTHCAGTSVTPGRAFGHDKVFLL